jgi:hypothetical protein
LRGKVSPSIHAHARSSGAVTPEDRRANRIKPVEQARRAGEAVYLEIVFRMDVRFDALVPTKRSPSTRRTAGW